MLDPALAVPIPPKMLSNKPFVGSFESASRRGGEVQAADSENVEPLFLTAGMPWEAGIGARVPVLPGSTEGALLPNRLEVRTRLVEGDVATFVCSVFVSSRMQGLS